MATFAHPYRAVHQSRVPYNYASDVHPARDPFALRYIQPGYSKPLQNHIENVRAWQLQQLSAAHAQSLNTQSFEDALPDHEINWLNKAKQSIIAADRLHEKFVRQRQQWVRKNSRRREARDRDEDLERRTEERREAVLIGEQWRAQEHGSKRGEWHRARQMPRETLLERRKRARDGEEGAPRHHTQDGEQDALTGRRARTETGRNPTCEDVSDEEIPPNRGTQDGDLLQELSPNSIENTQERWEEDRRIAGLFRNRLLWRDEEESGEQSLMSGGLSNGGEQTEVPSLIVPRSALKGGRDAAARARKAERPAVRTTFESATYEEPLPANVPGGIILTEVSPNGTITRSSKKEGKRPVRSATLEDVWDEEPRPPNIGCTDGALLTELSASGSTPSRRATIEDVPEEEPPPPNVGAIDDALILDLSQILAEINSAANAPGSNSSDVQHPDEPVELEADRNPTFSETARGQEMLLRNAERSLIFSRAMRNVTRFDTVDLETSYAELRRADDEASQLAAEEWNLAEAEYEASLRAAAQLREVEAARERTHALTPREQESMEQTPPELSSPTTSSAANSESATSSPSDNSSETTASIASPTWSPSRPSEESEIQQRFQIIQQAAAILRQPVPTEAQLSEVAPADFANLFERYPVLTLLQCPAVFQTHHEALVRDVAQNPGSENLMRLIFQHDLAQEAVERANIQAMISRVGEIDTRTGAAQNFEGSREALQFLKGTAVGVRKVFEGYRDTLVRLDVAEGNEELERMLETFFRVREQWRRVREQSDLEVEQGWRAAEAEWQRKRSGESQQSRNEEAAGAGVVEVPVIPDVGSDEEL